MTRQLEIGKHIGIHAGCGPIYLDGWTNIDISPNHKTDVCGDILEMDFEHIPVIYSCHMLEHLSYPYDATKCLKLFNKWLMRWGILRIAVPDLELIAKSYASGSDLKFIYGAEFKGYYHNDLPAERFNFFMREWEHKIAYDYTLLSELLLESGFIAVRKCQPNKSAIPDFTHDRFISESLYVEAIK